MSSSTFDVEGLKVAGRSVRYRNATLVVHDDPPDFSLTFDSPAAEHLPPEAALVVRVRGFPLAYAGNGVDANPNPFQHTYRNGLGVPGWVAEIHQSDRATK